MWRIKNGRFLTVLLRSRQIRFLSPELMEAMTEFEGPRGGWHDDLRRSGFGRLKPRARADFRRSCPPTNIVPQTKPRACE